MAEKHVIIQKRRTKEANLVIPLDEVRTVDVGFASVASGAPTTSGILYAIQSGKEAYIKQVIATNTIAAAGKLEIGKVVSGGYSQVLTLHVASGQTATLDTLIGPATSGFVVMSGSPFGGDVTLVVKVDPKVPE